MDDFLLLGGHAPTVWPGPKRAPLPPFPPVTGRPGPVWASHSYETDLWFDIPTKPDVSFYRGNFCGIAIPDGIKPLPGMAGYTVPSYPHPPVMALDIPRFPI